MRLRNLSEIFIVLLLSAVTGLSDAAAISISINPRVAREFVDKYNITCQYPAPAAVNTSTTGVLRITHLTRNEDVYYYDFGTGRETISNTLKNRVIANLNQTTNTLVLQVNVAMAADSSLYNCSLTDATSAYYATSPTPPFNVTGCVNGSLVKYLSQCSSLRNGDPCSITCTSSDATAMVSLSRNYDGSAPLISNVSEINFTKASVMDSDYGAYYCYVKTAACTSMKESAMTPYSVTTTPAKDANGTSCSGNGCRNRIPGWGIALIVIGCVLIVILILIILFVLHKKGIFRKKEGEVQPDNTRRSVANDNFAMSRSNEANEVSGKGRKNDKKSNEPMNFPEVKTRKNMLPPLTTTGNLRASETDQSLDGPASGRPLPKRRASIDENGSPDGGRRRRGSLGRRQSIEDGSPDRANKLPSIRGPARDYGDDDNDRF